MSAVPLIARLRSYGASPVGSMVIAFVAWNLAAMDQTLFNYAVPGMMKEFGMGLAVVGYMIAASYVIGIAASPLAGALCDLWGPRTILAVSLAAASLLVFAQAFAPTVLALGALRVASYGFSAGLAPVTSVLVANSAPPRVRALFIAIVQCAYPLGGFVASLAFIPLAAAGGWRTPFEVAIAVLPVAALMYLMLPPGRPAGRAATAATGRSPVRELFSGENRAVALLCIVAFFLYGGAVGGSNPLMPTFFQQQRGYPPATASLIVGLTFAIGAAGYLVAAVVSRSRIGLWRTTVLWSSVGPVLYVACVWLRPAFATDVLAFGIDAMFFFGTASILTTYLLEVFPPAIRGTAMAICGTVALTTGYAVFPVVVTHAVPLLGWRWALTTTVALPALVASAVIAAMPRRARVHLPELT